MKIFCRLWTSDLKEENHKNQKGISALDQTKAWIFIPLPASTAQFRPRRKTQVGLEMYSGGSSDGESHEATAQRKIPPASSMLWVRNLRRYIGSGAGLGSESLMGIVPLSFSHLLHYQVSIFTVYSVFHVVCISSTSVFNQMGLEIRIRYQLDQ